MVTKYQPESRQLTYLKKYRIFFIFGVILLSAQVYLAYSFFSLEYESQNAKPSEIKKFQNLKRKEVSLGKEYNLSKYTNAGEFGLTKNDSQTKLSTKLDLNFLNFVPICEVVGKEAISAISRAKTQYCKELIVNITCLSQWNALYPKTIQSYCPHSMKFQDFPTSLGCYLNKESHIFTSYYSNFRNTNSPQYCSSMCYQSGFPYAGVANSSECFCGKEEPDSSKTLPISKCDAKCPGDGTRRCGGNVTLHVYATGAKKFNPQTPNNISVEASNRSSVRIAYLLTVNGRASRQVKRLIKILYHPSHYFYIHVDSRQDYMYREMLKIEKNCNLKNILVAKNGNRHASIWGGASLLTTFLTSAKEMLLHFKDWDFLVNLSESDYPIKTKEKLVQFLSVNKNYNFVKSHGRQVQRFLTKQGLDKTFVECEARMWRVGDRVLPFGIQIDGGSDWVILNRQFVKYVAFPERDDLINNLKKVFKYTLLPAESFFHTALRNSKFCDTYVDNNLRVTNWKRKMGCKCQYKAIVDWCGCSPNDFKKEDIGRISNTAEKNLFFARKFEPIIDQEIVDYIDEWLYPNMFNGTSLSGRSAYWQSLYHYKDKSPMVDDAVLTISHFLAKQAYKKFGVKRNVSLIEITAYYESNNFSGVIVRARANILAMESSTLHNELPEEIEALVNINRNFAVKSEVWNNRIVSLVVNTEYDPKEQIFRNLLGAIGPLSSPILAYQFSEMLIVPHNFSILWINPHNFIAEINHLVVDDNSLIGHIKPNFKQPLMVGIWQVVVVSNDKIISTLNFLVTPLTFWKNSPISVDTSAQINYNPLSSKILKKFSSKWYKIINKISKIALNEENNIQNEIRYSWQIENWVDKLAQEYYKVIEICLVRSKNIKIKYSLSPKECKITSWSSVSPDIKSNTDQLCHS